MVTKTLCSTPFTIHSYPVWQGHKIPTQCNPLGITHHPCTCACNNASRSRSPCRRQHHHQKYPAVGAKMHTSFCAGQTAAALNSLSCTLCGIATSLVHARSASTTCTKAGAKCCRAAGLLHATHVDNSCNATSTLYALQLTAARACCAQVHNTIRIRIVHTKTYASKTHGTKWDSATTTCTHAVAKKPAQHPHRTETIQVASQPC